MLFALYVVDWGKALEESGEGVKVGDITIAALFFADDVVLVSRSAAGLKKLMEISEKETLRMKLTISESKSKVVSSGEECWNLHNENGEVLSTLEKVLEYKYLGVDTHGNIRKTTTAKQKKMVTAARRYRGACKYLSRKGPDSVELAKCLWRNVAIPAITFGVESVLVTETTIKDLDKESARWAKETLSLPTNTPNIVSQTIMGVPSFKQVIYTSQLKFYQRLKELPEHRFAAQALKENEWGGWKSPYSEHMYKIRSEIGLVSFPPVESLVEEIVSAFCIEELNNKMESLQSLPPKEPVAGLTTARSAKEGEDWFLVNLARMGGCAIKQSLDTEGRVGSMCLRDGVKNTDMHCVVECRSTKDRRRKTVVSLFFLACKERGISNKKGYGMFIDGLDMDGKEIQDTDYRERGKCLAAIFQPMVK